MSDDNDGFGNPRAVSFQSLFTISKIYCGPMSYPELKPTHLTCGAKKYREPDSLIREIVWLERKKKKNKKQK